MKQKKKKPRRKRRQANKRPKISELVWEFAGDFIRMGDSLEEKESLLNAACSAWNIASAPPDKRKSQIDHYVKEYLNFNSGADKAEVAGVRSDMEKLIEKKLEKFPGDLRQIVGARLVRIGDKDRIEVVSASIQ